MQKYMLDHVMFVKEWVSRHAEMNYHYNQLELYKHLRNGQLTSLDQSTPQPNIQRLGTSLPQLTTLPLGRSNSCTGLFDRYCCQVHFENIITRFGCPRSLTSDQGAHFISSTIATLTTEFLIQHHKSSPYHPQANGTVEAFNKILERGLTKVCCAN
jgi:hypothetical protein